MTHAAVGRFRDRSSCDVERKGVPRARDVRACMMAILAQTRAVEADEADVDAVVAVLQWADQRSARRPMVGIGRTWPSKHCVHSSRWTDWLSLGWRRFDSSDW